MEYLTPAWAAILTTARGFSPSNSELRLLMLDMSRRTNDRFFHRELLSVIPHGMSMCSTGRREEPLQGVAVVVGQFGSILNPAFLSRCIFRAGS